MASARDIQRRIKGVRNTRKITRAMEMIAATKMRKAVAAALAMRPYAAGVLDVLRYVSVAAADERNVLFTPRPVVSELYVVITSNRGLCGSFNAQIARRLRRTLTEDSNRVRRFITIGRKGDAMVRRMAAGDIIASFPDVIASPTPSAVRPVARVIMEEFLGGRADRVVVIYTNYVSAMVQEVKVRALLPVAIKDSGRVLDEETDARPAATVDGAVYAVEPSIGEIVRKVVPQLIEMELYHAILESNASRESAQMMAMKSATDAAGEMIADLTLAYNQIRQQKITQEIAEISAGMAAVRT